MQVKALVVHSGQLTEDAAEPTTLQSSVSYFKSGTAAYFALP